MSCEIWVISIKRFTNFYFRWLKKLHNTVLYDSNHESELLASWNQLWNICRNLILNIQNVFKCRRMYGLVLLRWRVTKECLDTFSKENIAGGDVIHNYLEQIHNYICIWRFQMFAINYPSFTLKTHFLLVCQTRYVPNYIVYSSYLCSS